MEIRLEDPSDLEAYCVVPIAFQIRSRLLIEPLRESSFVEIPVEPRWKDYDAFEEERPTALPSRFDISNWAVLAAFIDGQRVGGAVVAYDTPGFDMLQGRSNLAVLVDLRVRAEVKGQGMGRGLFRAACEWARVKGCTELIVETQDTNVAACRFYAAMGCSLAAADPQGYGEDLDEAKLIWRISLSA